MIAGTTSNAGKTTLVAGLCRSLARQGVRVAPFKAQNMSLNSAVTASGHEIGRAQFMQAQAAGIPAEVAMNPVLLKPTGDRASQIVVMGNPIGDMEAADYYRNKAHLFAVVLEALADLRDRFDVVLVEGAGSAAEINLLASDIVNLPLARAAEIAALVVGDIDLGGVFASLHGTVAVLPPDLRPLVQGFVINKFRGDPDLLYDGTAQLETLSGVPTLGVVPMLRNLHLDDEDSLALDHLVDHADDASARMDVAVIRFPRISNFTDLDPLALEPDVAVRYVRSARELGRPDLVVLPGSKATVDDLAWMRSRGLDRALRNLVNDRPTTTVLGICGGYQMLGGQIDDQVESGAGLVPGLGLLPVTTSFGADKVLTSPVGEALGQHVEGYQIHHGRIVPSPSVKSGEVWLRLGQVHDGIQQGSVLGTTLHGLFESDGFRRAFLHDVAHRAGVGFVAGTKSPRQHRKAEFDRLADHLEAHLDMAALHQLIARAS